MALHYLSPAEQVLAQFSTDDAARIGMQAVNGLSKLENNRHDAFHYALPAYAKKRLSERGIYISPFAYEPHSHPVCKTLESYIINVKLPNYIDDSFVVVGIKDNKLTALRKHKNLKLLDAINRCVTSHDIQRYGAEYHFEKASKDWVTDESLPNALQDLVPQLLRRKRGKREARVFLYDELHYWSMKDILKFLEVVQPEIVVASFVFPAEALIGATESMNPWAYEFEIIGNKMIFSPDGVHSEGYEQPLHAGDILKYKKIETRYGNYSVQVRDSTFCHHLVIISRDDLNNEEYRTFSDFDAVSTDDLRHFGGCMNSVIPVRCSTILSVFKYIRTLKKPDIQSGMAKHRQIVDDPSGYEIRFIEDFVAFLLENEERMNLISYKFTDFLKDECINLLPRPLHKFFKSYKGYSLGKFIEELRPLKFTFPCRTFHRDFVDVATFQLMPKLFESFDYGLSALNKIQRCLQGALSKKAEAYPTEINQGFFFLFDQFSSRLSKPLARNFIDIWLGRVEGSYYESLAKLKRLILLKGSKCVKHQSALINRMLYVLNGEGAVLLRTLIIADVTCRLRKRRSVRGLLEMPCMASAVQESGNLIDKVRQDWGACAEDVKSLVSGTSFISPLVKACKRDGPRQLQCLGSRINGAEFPTFHLPDELLPIQDKKKGRVVKSEKEPLTKSHTTTTDSSPLAPVTFELGTPSLPFGIKSVATKIAVLEEFVRELNFDCAHQHRGRRSIFFSGGFSYGFNSTTYESAGWPAPLKEIASSEYNSCLVQKYDENASIGFHSDNEECYDEDSRVLTVNLLGDATLNFKRKEGDQEVCSIRLKHGDAIEMPPYFQKHFLHSLSSTSEGRISLTFRLQKRKMDGTPIAAHQVEESAVVPEGSAGQEDPSTYYEVMNGCTITCASEKVRCPLSVFAVPADGNCFWHAVSSIFGYSALELKRLVRDRAASEVPFSSEERRKEFYEEMEDLVYASDSSVTAFCYLMSVRLIIQCTETSAQEWVQIEPLCSRGDEVLDGYLVLNCKTLHYNLAMPKEGCVLRAIAEFLKQNPIKILSVLSSNCSPDLLDELRAGLGIQDHHLQEIFEFFDIQASIFDGISCRTLNPEGKRVGNFTISDEHFSYSPNVRIADATESFVQSGAPMQSDLSKFEAFLRTTNVIAFEPSFARARKLADSLLSGQTGVLSSKIIASQSDWLQNKGKLFLGARKMGVVVGTFGSGKSSHTLNYLRENLSSKNVVITPRRNLRDQFIKNLGLDTRRKKGQRCQTEVVTFEVALKRVSLLQKARIFIDETQLFPPGYIDLICLIASSEASIVVMGDPAQSEYDSADDRNLFIDDAGCLDVILEGRKYNYISESKRFRNAIFEGRLPCSHAPGCFDAEDEDYYIFKDFNEFKANPFSSRVRTFLVSSFAEKNIIRANLGRKANVLTFGESTGLNLDYSCILLTQDSSLAGDKRWIVALSRASLNIAFINLTGGSIQEFATQMYGSPIYKFLTGRASVNDLNEILPGTPTFVKAKSRLGRDEVDREERLSGDPWLKGKIFLGQRPEGDEELKAVEAPEQRVQMKVHCPIASHGEILADVQSKMRSKGAREKRLAEDLITEQFTDTYKAKEVQLTNNADRFEAIYPRHKAGDTATFVMASRKRLDFSHSAKEMRKFKAALPYGEMMLAEFLKRIKVKGNFDHKLFEEARDDFEVKKLEKSRATIENHSGRSDKDWPIEKALIFMKSQLCTKFDNRFRDAKAGQTLACFHHDVLCRLAPFIRYIEKKVNAVLPKEMYIHSGKNFDDLEAWIVKNFRGGVCTESDYEAFDASQDCNILAFEVALMKHLRLPKDLIEDYKYLKFNTTSKLGDFAVMRFTGEAGTFLFNTLANMVFTFMRYDLNGRESICFAGDDMCANRDLRVRRDFEHVLERMKLKAKVQKTTKPTFCGWCIGSFGIYKRPQLVADRLAIAIEKGNLQDCIDNYAIEVSYAYNLGERLVSIMDDLELSYHYYCVRTIVKNKRLCKSHIAENFESCNRCSSPPKALLTHGSRARGIAEVRI
ncbi:replicase [Cherry robigovirus 5]|nr:replicase [Cherry robigovirus 5]